MSKHAHTKMTLAQIGARSQGIATSLQNPFFVDRHYREKAEQENRRLVKEYKAILETLN